MATTLRVSSACGKYNVRAGPQFVLSPPNRSNLTLAKLKVMVKHILNKCDCPSKLQEAVNRVLMQAELLGTD